MPVNLIEILNSLQTLIPKINLINLPKLQLAEKIQFADTVNIQINLKQVNLEQTNATAIITSRKHHPGNEIEEHSIGFLPQEDQQQSRLIAQTLPFGSGTHLIINQPSWWATNASIRIAERLKIIPICMGELITVNTFETMPSRTFDVRLETEDLFMLQVWGQRKEKSIHLSQPEPFVQGNSLWIVEKYLPGAFMSFATLPEIILSFDRKIVRQVILIERQPDIEEPEYYVLVTQAETEK